MFKFTFKSGNWICLPSFESTHTHTDRHSRPVSIYAFIAFQYIYIKLLSLFERILWMVACGDARPIGKRLNSSFARQHRLKSFNFLEYKLMVSICIEHFGLLSIAWVHISWNNWRTPRRTLHRSTITNCSRRERKTEKSIFCLMEIYLQQLQLANMHM